MKPYAVEAKIINIGPNKTDLGFWFIWNKYKTIKSMLQGLSELRKNNHVSCWETPLNGKTVICKFIWQYRPVHYER